MQIIPISSLDIEQYYDFDCGIRELNEYLLKYAKQNHLRNIGKTFVLIDQNKALGYYTLSSASIEFEAFDNLESSSLPKYPIPCIRIVRLAVSLEKQNKSFGSFLLKDAFMKICEVSKTIGFYLIIVDAKNTSKSFYEQFGFKRYSKAKFSYFIILKTVKESLK